MASRDNACGIVPVFLDVGKSALNLIAPQFCAFVDAVTINVAVVT